MKTQRELVDLLSDFGPLPDSEGLRAMVLRVQTEHKPSIIAFGSNSARDLLATLLVRAKTAAAGGVDVVGIEQLVAALRVSPPELIVDVWHYGDDVRIYSVYSSRGMAIGGLTILRRFERTNE